MSPTATDHITRLADYRLARSLTFEALAAEMADAGFAIPARALHLALTNRLKTRPRETTLWKITQFVDGLDARSKAPRAKGTPRPRSRRRTAA
jgi:hypothetical protein